MKKNKIHDSFEPCNTTPHSNHRLTSIRYIWTVWQKQDTYRHKNLEWLMGVWQAPRWFFPGLKKAGFVRVNLRKKKQCGMKKRKLLIAATERQICATAWNLWASHHPLRLNSTVNPAIMHRKMSDLMQKMICFLFFKRGKMEKFEKQDQTMSLKPSLSTD